MYFSDYVQKKKTVPQDFNVEQMVKVTNNMIGTLRNPKKYKKKEEELKTAKARKGSTKINHESCTEQEQEKNGTERDVVENNGKERSEEFSDTKENDGEESSGNENDGKESSGEESTEEESIREKSIGEEYGDENSGDETSEVEDYEMKNA